LIQQIIASLRIENPGIADVSSIKEIQEVQPATERKDSDIKSSVKSAVAFFVKTIISSSFD
jgi:hypothetical protein